jgi:hypothetical protein
MSGPVILTTSSIIADINWDYQVVTSFDANTPPRPLVQKFYRGKGDATGELVCVLTYTWTGSGTGTTFPTSVARSNS